MQETYQTRRVNLSDETALALASVGAINWGLIGLFSFNLVSRLFGTRSFASRLVYSLVGAAGIYTLYFAYKAGTSTTLPLKQAEEAKRAA